mgnify:CR=1 FL=1|jgi:hypothetical protein
MFHAMMDKIGVMEIIAPFSESSEVVLAIQARDIERTVNALNSDEPRTMLTATKCGVLHLAAQCNFVQLIEYLHNQQNVGVDDRDAVSCRWPCGFHTDFLNIWWCSPLTLVFFLLAVRTGTLPCTTRREVGTSSRRPC